ncbi:helix-turn-helix domain-containing protein [Paenisporosarcina quisquiliarum]|uniref:Helix-turn-helix domain-containing protein n=1 Tax=Paenisporosarcina quisquiliarum TaxID=365346 RepID=A0A9X3LF21_9BACL|nr:Rgg/GadR/MutR family transcriptional regulator [Paenisporosarcina quisquiliarum]MCZ8536782.1 helix-turn-helix domain-containing protein [Paenisporosarcina quisquiliarum]
MELYGEVFREIRISRGLTIEDLADQYVSKSTISRFERLESDITLEKLLHLLNKIKVSLREFVFLSSQKTNIPSSLEFLSKAVIENNPTMLKGFVDEEWLIYEKTSSIYSKLTAIVLESHYKSLLGEEVGFDDNVAFLTDYFFQCDVWTQFDVVLFADSISYLPIETSIVLSKEIMRKTQIFHKDRQSFETLINTLENIILVCLENNRINEANEFIKIIDQLEIDETYLLEKVIMKFIKGVYLFKTGNETKGRKNIEESLLAMHLAEAFQFEKIFQEYAQKLL